MNDRSCRGHRNAMLPSLSVFCWALLGLLGSALPTSATGGLNPIRSFDTGGLEARSAALILSGQKGGDLKASALAVPLDGDAMKVRVALIIDIEGGSLLQGQPAGEDLITEIYAYALDESGGVGGFMTQAFRLDLEEYRPLLEQRGLKFLGHLELAPGFYKVQILVRQRRTEKFNLQSLALAVEKPGLTGSNLLLPLFLEPPEKWLLVSPAPVEGEASVASLLWTLGSQKALPSTFPVLRNDLPAHLFLLGEAAAGPLEGRLRDLGGALVESVSLDLGETIRGPGGRDVRAVRVAPTLQPPGQYFLEIERPAIAPLEGQGTKVGGKPAVIAGISVAVLPAQAGDDLPTWAQLLRPAETVEATAPEEGTTTTAARHRKVGLTRWWKAYRRALLDSEEGQGSKAAIGELIELERSQLTGKPKRRGSRIREEQLAAALELARKNPESLVPLIRFHERQYQRHHGKRRYQLATHSRQLSVRLADAYLELSDTQGARRIAAANLVSMAGYLQAVGSGPSARQAFEKALEYDPENEAALLGLGALLEGNDGDYEAAEKVLRTLVEIRPRNSEARLRLAVNLRRLGRLKESERLFRESVQAPAARWVRTVAYQELARLLLDTKRAPLAVEVLLEGLRELPNQQRFHIQLAAAYDFLERPAAARRALEKLDPRAARDHDSPRFIYWRRPTWAIEASRRFLDENATNRLPVLADSLSAVGSDVGSDVASDSSGGGGNAGK